MMSGFLSTYNNFTDQSLVKYISQVYTIPTLSIDREKFLAQRLIEHADVLAARELVVSHLRLVVKIAFRFKNYGLPMSDVISEGNIGLMKAVKKFRLEMNCRLSTYAIWWIKASIQNYILKTWSFLKIGTSFLKKKLFCNLKEAKNKLSDYHEHDAEKNLVSNCDELSRLCRDDDIPSDISHSLKECDSSNIENVGDMIACGLDEPLIDGEDGDERFSANSTSIGNYYQDDYDTSHSFIDTLHDTNSVDPERAAIDKQFDNFKIMALNNALELLNERERNIIRARHLSEKPATLDDLSKIHNISKERVRQIECSAFEKLKLSMRKNVDLQQSLTLSSV